VTALIALPHLLPGAVIVNIVDQLALRQKFFERHGTDTMQGVETKHFVSNRRAWTKATPRAGTFALAG
jgi:hypothetical protein